jgi:hypothetical protein
MWPSSVDWSRGELRIMLAVGEKEKEGRNKTVETATEGERGGGTRL